LKYKPTNQSEDSAYLISNPAIGYDAALRLFSLFQLATFDMVSPPEFWYEFHVFPIVPTS